MMIAADPSSPEGREVEFHGSDLFIQHLPKMINCPEFGMPFLNHFWSILTTADQEVTTRPAVLL